MRDRPSKTYRESALVASGSDAVIEVGVPFRGMMNRAVVRQTSGALEGFTVDIYERRDDVAAGSSSSLDVTDLSGSVGPRLTANSMADEAAAFGVFYPYTNGNGSLAKRVPKLYVVIDPAGSGDKHFEIELSISAFGPS